MKNYLPLILAATLILGCKSIQTCQECETSVKRYECSGVVDEAWQCRKDKTYFACKFMSENEYVSNLARYNE